MAITYDENGNETLRNLPVSGLVHYVTVMLRRCLGANATAAERDALTSQLLRAYNITKRQYVAAAKRHERKLQMQHSQPHATTTSQVAPSQTTSCAKQ